MIESLQQFFSGKRRRIEKPKVIVIEVPALMRKGEYADVIAIRHPLDSFTKFTNVPWIMGDNMDEAMGYEWGYSGCGPTDFAFNILLHFTDHDEAVTRAYTIDFREEHIRAMPSEGGRIKKEDISDFIERMKVTKPGLLEMVRKHLELTTPVACPTPRSDILPLGLGTSRGAIFRNNQTKSEWRGVTGRPPRQSTMPYGCQI